MVCTKNHKKEGFSMKKNSIPVHEKYVLTIREAAEYFNIGLKRMRQLAEENTDSFGLWSGNRFLIIRSRFEEYLLGCLTEKGVRRDLRKPKMEEKDLFTAEEAIEYYGLSRRKFIQLLNSDERLPFVALYRTRKLIIRSEYERYMDEHPEVKEEIRNGR